MPRPRISNVWNHFTPVDNTKAICGYCGKIRCHTGGSTTNLMRHVKSKHPSVLLNSGQKTSVRAPVSVPIPDIAENIELLPYSSTSYPSGDPILIHVSGRSEEACYSYGDRHVYPQETSRSTGHSLYASKAKISKPAPDWEGTAVVNGEFKELKLKDFRGKYLVFFFYPLDFTFVCPTEIIAFSERVKEFHAINTEVVACSVDSQFTHLAWINTPRKLGGLGPLNIPILSDLTHQISKDYGVYLEDLGHTLRGLFIVDDKGILRQITMNDLPVGRSIEESLRLVQAFQFTDKHGEVCPAGWKPGGDTIIPNPEDKLKYFSKFDE